MDRQDALQHVNSITPEEVRRLVAEGRRLRSEAVAQAFRALWRRLAAWLRTPPAVAHERRERMRRSRRVRSAALCPRPGAAG